MKVPVNCLSTLKRLEKKGFITLHPHTGQKVRNIVGVNVTAWYIQDYKQSRFEVIEKQRFRDVKRIYTIEYQSGCFKPFVWMETITDF